MTFSVKSSCLTRFNNLLGFVCIVRNSERFMACGKMSKNPYKSPTKSAPPVRCVELIYVKGEEEQNKRKRSKY